MYADDAVTGPAEKPYENTSGHRSPGILDRHIMGWTQIQPVGHQLMITGLDFRKRRFEKKILITFLISFCKFSVKSVDCM